MCSARSRASARRSAPTRPTTSRSWTQTSRRSQPRSAAPRARSIEAVAHSHGDGHDKGTPTGRAGARYAGRLRLAFVLAVAFLLVEAVTAFVAGSLALLSDAAHLLTDAVGIGMALAAIRLADRAGGDRSRTFGLYRLEILAALANAVFLFVVTGYVLVEAGPRPRPGRALEAGAAPRLAGGPAARSHPPRSAA